MRTSALLSLPFLAVALVAQTPDRNIVHHNNQNYLWVGAIEPVSGMRFLPTTISPPAYTNPGSLTGVSAGSRTWRWIPYAHNARKEVRQVSGMVTTLHVTPLTTVFPHTGYRWGVNFYPAVARTGGGMDPDFSAAPLVTIAQGTYTWTAYRNVRLTTSFSTPIPLPGDDVCMAVNWRGGEHELVPGSQAHYGSSYEAPYTPMSWGFADAAGVITYGTATNTFPMFAWLETAPTIAAHSDWGESRQAPRTPPLEGTGMGTGQADLATMGGNFGWTVYGGASRAGQLAVPLFNVGAISPLSFSLFGQTIEVNVADTSLGLLMGSYSLLLDAAGTAIGPRIPAGPLGPSAIGVHIGMEFVTVDPLVPAFTGSTQAYYIRISR